MVPWGWVVVFLLLWFGVSIGLIALWAYAASRRRRSRDADLRRGRGRGRPLPAPPLEQGPEVANPREAGGRRGSGMA